MSADPPPGLQVRLLRWLCAFQWFFRVEAGRQVVIAGGVPNLIVKPVEDAVHVKVAVAQELVQAAAPFVGHDLPGIGRTDRADLGGVVDAPGHEVHFAELLLGQTVREQTEVLKHIPGGIDHFDVR